MESLRWNRRGVQSRIEWYMELKPCDFRRKLLKDYLRDIRKYSRSTKESIRTKYIPGKRTENSISVLTRFAGSTLDAVRMCIQSLGFVEVLEPDEGFDIVWCGTSDTPPINLLNGFMNKFPGASGVLSKISTFRALENLRCLLPKTFKFYPKTWFLPFQKQALVHVSNRCEASEQKCTYIVKPDSGTQGKGIYLFQSPQFYTTRPQSGERDTKGEKRNSSSTVTLELADETRGQNINGLHPALDVVQRYEPSPLLLFGYKTDLRIYVLIESIAPLRIYVYRDGLVRLASRPYEQPSKSNLGKNTMHLTNYAINKLRKPTFSANSIQPEEEKTDECSQATTDVSASMMATTTATAAMTKTPTAGTSAVSTPILDRQSVANVNLHKVGASAPQTGWRCKQSLSSLLSNSSTDRGPWSHLDSKRLWAKIDDIVRSTIFALSPYLKVSYWATFGHPAKPAHYSSLDENGPRDPHSFQIIGFDFLLLEPDARPVLLEVNSNPSLRTDALHSFLSRSTLCSDAAESTMPPDVLPTHFPKRLSRAFSPCGPVAEAATLLSCVLGDRYAQFERSTVDVRVKGGLVKATLKLIAARIRDRRAKRGSCGESMKISTPNPPTLVRPSTTSRSSSTRVSLSSVKPAIQLPILIHTPEKVGRGKYQPNHSSPKLVPFSPKTCKSNTTPSVRSLQANDSSETISRSNEVHIPKMTTPKTWSSPTVCDRTDSLSVSSGHNSNVLRNEKQKSKLPRLAPRSGYKMDELPRAHHLISSYSQDLDMTQASELRNSPKPMRTESALLVRLPDGGPTSFFGTHTPPLTNASHKLADFGQDSQNQIGSSWPDVQSATSVRQQVFRDPSPIVRVSSEDELSHLDLVYTEGTRTYEVSSEECYDEYVHLIDKLYETKMKLGSQASNPYDWESPWIHRLPFVASVNLSAFDSPARIIELLADMFLCVLTARRRRLQKTGPPKDPDLLSDDWTTNTKCSAPSQPAGDLFIPRMDLSSFRAFCRRCQVDKLGLTYTELDLIFAKQRSWWQRVYEPDLCKHSRELCTIRGLSFPAFVDLCLQLSRHCCSRTGSSSETAHLNPAPLPVIPLCPFPMDELDPDLSARVQRRRYQKRQQSTDTVSKLDSISTTVQKLGISGRSAPLRDVVMVTDGNQTKGKQDKQRPTKRLQQHSRYSPNKPAGHSAPTPRPISEHASHSYGNSTVWTEPYEQLRCLFRFIEHCCCSDHFLNKTTYPSRQK